jgi:hypothetical protein
MPRDVLRCSAGVDSSFGDARKRSTEAKLPRIARRPAATLRLSHRAVSLRELGLERLRLAEGRAAQILHVGPYAAEAPTIEQLHAFSPPTASSGKAGRRDLLGRTVETSTMKPQRHPLESTPGGASGGHHLSPAQQDFGVACRVAGALAQTTLDLSVGRRWCWVPGTRRR